MNCVRSQEAKKKKPIWRVATHERFVADLSESKMRGWKNIGKSDALIMRARESRDSGASHAHLQSRVAGLRHGKHGGLHCLAVNRKKSGGTRKYSSVKDQRKLPMTGTNNRWLHSAQAIGVKWLPAQRCLFSLKVLKAAPQRGKMENDNHQTTLQATPMRPVFGRKVWICRFKQLIMKKCSSRQWKRSRLTTGTQKLDNFPENFPDESRKHFNLKLEGQF